MTALPKSTSSLVSGAAMLTSSRTSTSFETVPTGGGEVDDVFWLQSRLDWCCACFLVGG